MDAAKYKKKDTEIRRLTNDANDLLKTAKTSFANTKTHVDQAMAMVKSKRSDYERAIEGLKKEIVTVYEQFRAISDMQNDLEAGKGGDKEKAKIKKDLAKALDAETALRKKLDQLKTRQEKLKKLEDHAKSFSIDVQI